jgi:hypothetical protein
MEKQEYYKTRGLVVNASGKRDTFAQLVGEHALHFVDLMLADRAGDKRAMMSTWVKISRLNDDWLTLVCPVHHDDNKEFRSVSEKVIGRYAEVLGDYILDTNASLIGSQCTRADTDRKVAEIVKHEADFYASLVSANNKELTKRHWLDYTRSIGSAVFALDTYGNESDVFYNYATYCIHTARALGRWLDHAVWSS